MVWFQTWVYVFCNFPQHQVSIPIWSDFKHYKDNLSMDLYLDVSIPIWSDFKHIVRWFESSDLKDSLYSNMVWFQTLCKRVWIYHTMNVVSIPIWSDFKHCDIWIPFFIFFVSIPIWSDFKLLKQQKGERLTKGLYSNMVWFQTYLY